MALINVLDITVLDNPAPFTNPFQFEVPARFALLSALPAAACHARRAVCPALMRRAACALPPRAIHCRPAAWLRSHPWRRPPQITFECIQALAEDIEWKLIYVGSAYDRGSDQELESILVGPIPEGVNKIVFQADAPDPARIPPGDLLGPTVILLDGLYRNQKFIQIGYYVNNEYATEELRETPPEHPMVDSIVRGILHDQPRVTRYDINWEGAAPNAEQPFMYNVDAQEAAGLEEMMAQRQYVEGDGDIGADDLDDGEDDEEDIDGADLDDEEDLVEEDM